METGRGRSPSGRQLLVGYLAAFCSMVSSMFSATCVQALQGAVPDFQLSAIRAAVQGVIYLAIGLIVSTDFLVKREHVPKLIYSGFVFLCYSVGFFAGATYLALGDLEGIAVISGIAFAVVQAKLLFNRDIEKCVILAAVVCTVGIVLTVQPSWIFTKMTEAVDNSTTSHFDTSSTHQSGSISSRDLLAGYMFGILGGAGQGLMCDVNGVILQDVKIIPKATYGSFLTAVGSVAFMFYLEDPVYSVDINQFLLVLGHSLFSAGNVILAISAACIISGPTLSVVWSFEVVTMLLSQYTIMHSVKPGNYNWVEVLGCIIIVCGASIPGVINILAHRAKADELP